MTTWGAEAASGTAAGASEFEPVSSPPLPDEERTVVTGEPLKYWPCPSPKLSPEGRGVLNSPRVTISIEGCASAWPGVSAATSLCTIFVKFVRPGFSAADCTEAAGPLD